jgi:alpha-beta hydrolase superfamily lysophospholipase
VRSARAVVALVSLLAAALLALLLLRLGRLERGGPVHHDLVLSGGIPATLYLPGVVSSLEPPPRDERAPVVVLVHGFASDRVGLSVLARSLCEAGYAVLSLDLRGHGENRTPFAYDLLTEDVGAAVDAARVSPWVDGARVAVAGHSMGASAALAYGQIDPGIDALVLISGGRRLAGPNRPPNVLLLTASGDPARIRDSSRALAERLSGEAPLAPGRTTGSLRDGTGVRRVEIAGADHLSIVLDSDAIAEIVAWLDAVFGREHAEPARRADPRLPVVLAGFGAFLLLLPGLGIAVGGLAPPRAQTRGDGAAWGLVLLGAALVATLPFFAAGAPGAFLPLVVGDVLVPHLGAAGVLLLCALALAGRLAPGALRVERRSFLAAGAALVAVYLALAPLAVTIHRLSLTPERLAAALACALVLLPFTLAFHVLLRRGSLLRASLTCLAGRALLVAVLAGGIAAGIAPPVVSLMLPMLVFVLVLVEVLCGGVYAVSRDTAVCALVEAGWLAWIFAAVLPIRI